MGHPPNQSGFEIYDLESQKKELKIWELDLFSQLSADLYISVFSANTGIFAGTYFDEELHLLVYDLKTQSVLLDTAEIAEPDLSRPEITESPRSIPPYLLEIRISDTGKYVWSTWSKQVLWNNTNRAELIYTRVIDTESGETALYFSTVDERYQTAISPDEETIVTYSSNLVTTYDLNTGSKKSEAPLNTTAKEKEAINSGITFTSESGDTLYILSYFGQGTFGENANRTLRAYNTQTGEVRFTTELEFNSYAPYESFFGKFREGSVIIGETSFGNTYHIDPQTGNAESQLDIMPFDFAIRVTSTTDVEIQGDFESLGDGRWISLGQDGAIRTWQPTGGVPIPSQLISRNNTIIIEFPTQPDSIYRIQSSNDVKTWGLEPLQISISENTGSAPITLPSEETTFFRAVEYSQE